MIFIVTQFFCVLIDISHTQNLPCRRYICIVLQGVVETYQNIIKVLQYFAVHGQIEDKWQGFLVA